MSSCSEAERINFFSTPLAIIEQSPINIPRDQFLEVLINNIRNLAIKYASEQRRNFNNDLDIIMQELRFITRREIHNLPVDVNRKQYLKDLYKEKLSEKSKEYFLNRNSKWIKEGEKMSPSFFNLGKDPSKQRYIPELYLPSKVDNNGGIPLSRNQELIETELHSYYKELYLDNDNVDRTLTIENFLGENNNNYKLDNDLAQKLDLPLRIDELDSFMRGVDKSSAPGITGLSYLFYSE